MRSCNNGTCKLLKPEVEPVNTPAFTPSRMKMRVLRQEVDVQSHYDPTKKQLFVKVPKIITIRLYPKGRV